MMANEKRLIEALREMADRTPPICQYDKPHNTEIFGEKITVYCKPFEQFQELLRRAADALSVDAVEVKHGRLEHIHEGRYLKVRCTACGRDVINVDTAVYDIMYPLIKWAYCPNCGAKMDGGKDNET